MGRICGGSGWTSMTGPGPVLKSHVEEVVSLVNNL